ncbi:MAG: hypothetical protein ACOYB8_10555 [Eubacteriaceae bacterium]|jgi:hypothetical protein
MLREMFLKSFRRFGFYFRPVLKADESGTTYTELLIAAAVLIIGLTTLTVLTSQLLQSIKNTNEINASGQISGFVLELCGDDTHSADEVVALLTERFPGFRFECSVLKKGLYELRYWKQDKTGDRNVQMYKTLFYKP